MREPFNDVSLADVINLLYAKRDVSENAYARHAYNVQIENLLYLGEIIRERLRIAAM